MTGFGSLVGAGVVGSIIATAPALLRLEGATGVCSPFGAWAVLIAATVLPMSLLVLALQRARGGFMALGMGRDKVPLAMLLGWISSTFAVMVFVGALLRARTHNHALAGVTFAIAGLVLALVLALVWTRLVQVARRIPAHRRTGIAVAMGTGFALALVWIGRDLSRRSSPPLPILQDVKVLDGLAFAVGALVASGRSFAHRRALALVGPPFAAVIVVLGVSSWRTCPSLRDALSGHAPDVSWAVGLLGSN